MSQDSSNPYSSPMKYSQAPSGAGQLASLGDRFLGALVDGLIVMAIVFPVGFVLGATGVLGADDSLASTLITNLVSGVIGIGVFMALHGYLLSTRGQTIGKYVVKTKIVSEATGQQLPFGELMLKRYLPLWIVSMIPWVGPIVGIVNVLLIFRANRHCLHDDIAGSKVISLK